MSAFVISTEAMDRCVDALTYQDKFGYALYSFESIPMPLWDKSDLGRKLFQLNVEAVAQRYCEPPQEFYYKYNGGWKSGSLVDGIKALDSLIYQCSEGDVPDTPTFKELNRALGILCTKVVRDMPAYDKAPWG